MSVVLPTRRVNMSSLTPRAGFTLIELLVVVGIAIVMAGVGIAALRRAGANSLLPTEGAKLVSELRRIELSAITGTKPESGCTALLGYEVEFSQSSPYYYRSRPDCIPTAISWTNPIVVTKTLPASLALTTNPTGALKFKVLAQGVAQAMRICLLDTVLQKKYEMLISSVGEIRDIGLSKVAYAPSCDAP